MAKGLRTFGYGVGLLLIGLGSAMVIADALATGGFVTLLGFTAIGLTKVTE